MSRKDKNTKVDALQYIETSHIRKRNMMHGHSVCLQIRVHTHIGDWKPITCLFVTNSREKWVVFLIFPCGRSLNHTQMSQRN